MLRLSNERELTLPGVISPIHRRLRKIQFLFIGTLCHRNHPKWESRTLRLKGRGTFRFGLFEKKTTLRSSPLVVLLRRASCMKKGGEPS